jgi:N-hydroxyarylamine O-acetyltransferase
MKLQAYLDRVKFEGKPRADLDTLTRLHRGHVENIPYENFDVQLERPISRKPEAIFDKLVTRRRGGWCYEMNGLLSWALDEIGFRHTRVAGGVMRAVRGDWSIGNHLVLSVDLDELYLADVGFGDGLIEPVPIVAGPIRQPFFGYSLEDMGQGWWRFHNDPRGGAPSFDFEMKRGDESLLDAKCAWLQSHQDSIFVQNAVVQRYLPDRFALMRGKVLKTIDARDVHSSEIGSADEYVATLESVFGLTLPDAHALWPKIEERHRQLFEARS